MLISHFSRDGKRGFAIGSNNLTPEKIAAGLVTAASGLLIAGIGGLFKPKRSRRAGAKSRKKKVPLWLLVLPVGYKGAKTAFKKKSYDSLISGLTEWHEAEQRSEIEVVDALPISSEDEVYEHI